MLKRLFRIRVLRFLVGGGIAALLNLILIYALIEGLGFDTPLLRNVANAIAIEVSLLASFFIYRTWVWTGGVWSLRDVMLRQIPLYHLSAGAAVLLRIFVIFPLLDWWGVNYGINTLVGVLASATLNYVISDRLVFKVPQKHSQKSNLTEIYPPEGLAPALERSHIPPRRSRLDRPDRSYPIQTFSIVIPAYNEEESIEPTVRTIVERFEAEEIDYEILVVNDNSRDRTEAILQELHQENERVRYINNYYPNGFGFAVRCGLENFQGDAVAIVMADSSDSPENMIDYYDALQEG